MTTAPTSASPPAPQSSPAAPPVGASLRNVLVTPAVRDGLVRAYVAAMHYRREWITGTQPGSVFPAYDSASRAYLAWAAFQTARNAPEKVFVGMQGEGSMTGFRRQTGGVWETYDICGTPAFFAFVGGVLPAGRQC